MRRRIGLVPAGRWFAALAGSLIGALSWTGAAGAETPTGTPDAYGAALRAWTARYRVGQGFVVARHGGAVYRFAVGGIDPRASVHLASLSKAITAACVATLVRDSKLSFGTPLSTALARFFAANGAPADPRAGAITIGQLITHRSGIGGKQGGDPAVGRNLRDYLRANSAREPPTPTMLTAVFKTPLASPPGARYDYSNAGYLVLGAVTEEATGKPYLAYCHDAVLTPVGATGDFEPAWQVMGPYGGWRMTGEDYLKVLDLFDPGDRRLGDAAKAFMLSPAGKMVSGDGTAWYGLGTNVRRTGAGVTIWHWGAWRYNLLDAKDGHLTASIQTFEARVPDGTAWFVYLTPGVPEGAPWRDLDRALVRAYRSVKSWN